MVNGLVGKSRTGGLWRVFGERLFEGIWPFKMSPKCEYISQEVMCYHKASSVDKMTH